MSQLEKEIKRLRYALGETLKMNAVLQNELQKLRKKDLKEEKRSSINELGNTYFVSSPPIGDFSDTLNQIYKSARSKKQSACTLPRITNSGK